MSDLFNQGEVLLTAAHIRAQRAKLDIYAGEIARLERERGETIEWLKMVAKLIGPEKAAALVGPLDDQATASFAERPARPERITWTGFIESYVNSASRGVDYSELRQAIASSVLASKLEKTDKSFYGAIGKLVDAGKLFKANGLLFNPSTFMRLQEQINSGEIAADRPPAYRESPMADAILEALKGAGGGMTSREVVASIRAIDEFREVVERNATSVYNVLTRMTKRGQITKDGKTYHLGSERNENSGSEQEAAV